MDKSISIQHLEAIENNGKKRYIQFNTLDGEVDFLTFHHESPREIAEYFRSVHPGASYEEF